MLLSDPGPLLFAALVAFILARHGRLLLIPVLLLIGAALWLLALTMLGGDEFIIAFTKGYLAGPLLLLGTALGALAGHLTRRKA